jgi:hypothetical protein
MSKRARQSMIDELHLVRASFCDSRVAMAMLVRATDRETPEWKQIIITRRLDRVGGGVDMAVKK